MYRIESKAGQRQFISGWFLHEQDAVAFIASMPEEDRGRHQLHEVPGGQYPAYVLERRTGATNHFAYADRLGAIAAVTAVAETADDVVHFNIYRLDGDFAPRVPGRDEMGFLPHVHVDNDYIRRFRLAGMGADPVGL